MWQKGKESVKIHVAIVKNVKKCSISMHEKYILFSKGNTFQQRRKRMIKILKHLSTYHFDLFGRQERFNIIGRLNWIGGQPLVITTYLVIIYYGIYYSFSRIGSPEMYLVISSNIWKHIPYFLGALFIIQIKYRGEVMAQIFIYIVVKLMQVMLTVLLASVRLAWKIIKGEFYLTKECFRKYPIGFFSFFIHFIGFLMAAGMSFYPNGSIFLRLYTLGIFGDMDDYGDFVSLPLDWLFSLIPSSGDDNVILGLIGYFIMMWLLLSVTLLVVEALFLLFPIIYAALTQLILGVPFKGFVNRWRNKRNEKYLRKVEKKSQANQVSDFVSVPATTPSASLASSQPEIVDEGVGKISVTFQRRFNRPYIRDMEESYMKAIERTTERTVTLEQVREALIKKSGERKSVEYLYKRTFELHYELVDVYDETLEIICCSTDMQEVNQAYVELKRAIMLLKNSQADLTNEMKKAYGISA